MTVFAFSEADLAAIAEAEARIAAAGRVLAPMLQQLYDTIALAEAELQGLVAYVFHFGRDRCPFVPQSELALAWLKGWDVAHLRAHPEDAP